MFFLDGFGTLGLSVCHEWTIWHRSRIFFFWDWRMLDLVTTSRSFLQSARINICFMWTFIYEDVNLLQKNEILCCSRRRSKSIFSVDWSFVKIWIIGNITVHKPLYGILYTSFDEQPGLWDENSHKRNTEVWQKNVPVSLVPINEFPSNMVFISFGLHFQWYYQCQF